MYTWQTWLIAVICLYTMFLGFWALQAWLGRHMQGLGLLLFGRPSFASRLYFWLLAPGVILHEMSHWLMAKLLWVATGRIALFRPTPTAYQNSRQLRNYDEPSAPSGKVVLGYVEVSKTDPIRQSLIGLAPLLTGLLGLLTLATALKIRSTMIDNANLGQVLLNLPRELFNSFDQPVNFLWLYLVFSVSNGMLPSAADRKPWLLGFFLPAAIILGLGLAGYLQLPSDWQNALYNFLGMLTWIFAFAALINLLLTLIVMVLEYLVSRLRRRKVVYRR